MPRGGRRPGAGAPKGNFNALKHGRRSAQFAELGAQLAGNPKTREAVLNFARRLDPKQESAVKSAIELHARIIKEARKIARGEPSPLEHVLRDENGAGSEALRLTVQSHIAERRSIDRNRPSGASRQHGRAHERKNRRPHNQTPNAAPANNQTSNTKPALKRID